MSLLHASTSSPTAVPTFATLGEGWLACLAEVVDHGDQETDDGVALLEVRNYIMRIEAVDRDDPVIMRYADQDRIDLMLLKYRSLEILPQYTMCYGALLYDLDGFNQVEVAVRKLRAKPETKAATLTFHKPGAIELSCISLVDFKLRHAHLEMTVVYRSQNVFSSQPGNLLALRAVQEYVADSIGADIGPLVLHALSAHVYEPELADARRVLDRARKAE